MSFVPTSALIFFFPVVHALVAEPVSGGEQQAGLAGGEVGDAVLAAHVQGALEHSRQERRGVGGVDGTTSLAVGDAKQLGEQ